MWFIGLAAGLLLGGLSGSGGWALVGGILGLASGVLYGEHLKNRNANPLEARVDALEKQVRKLMSQIAALQAAAQPGAESQSTPAVKPVQPVASPQPQTTEMPLTLNKARAAEASARETSAPAPAVLRAEAVLRQAQEESEKPAEFEWMSNLFKGNVLAKVGVVILFFGIASGLKLAVDMGLFPMSVRLMLGALAAIAMSIFGYRRAQSAEHRMFGQALQGGGMGILYLLVYFMLARYQIIGETLAFSLFTLIGVVGVLLAARQDARSLAALGISGAFLSPVLAASGGGSQVTLFSYFLLLNLFIISVNWFKGWRELNIAGFIFTLVIGLGWAFHSYTPNDFPVSETFLILFFLLYSATPVLFNLFNAPGRMSWSEGMLLYGTPLAAAALQNHLLRGQDMTLAWNACAAGAYYLLLWWSIQRRADEETVWLEKSLLGIAIGFFTLAIPLAFDAQLTAAFWMLEGYGVLYLGVKQDRFLARLSGSALQVLAGIYFFVHHDEFQRMLPILNDWYIGCVIVTIAALASALLLQQTAGAPASEEKTVAFASGIDTSEWAAPFLYWCLLWWFGAGLAEIQHFAPVEHHAVQMLTLGLVSFVALEWLGSKRNWPAMRQVVVLLPFAAVAAALVTYEQFGHALSGFMLWVLPLAVAGEYWILRRHDEDEISAARQLRHALAYWFLLVLAGSELAWLSGQLAPGNTLWSWLAWGVAGAAGVLITMRGLETEAWPIARQRELYLGTLQIPVALALSLWLVFGNLTMSGGGSGLPYLPLLNPFDLVQMLAMYALWKWLRAGETEWMPLLYGLAFLWISAEAARLAYHWGGIPFEAHALFDSSMLQAGLSMLWTAIAMGVMVYASRLGKRTLWFNGFGLLAIVGVKLMMVDLANKGTVLWTVSLIGIALLILGASYFSPVPPEGGESVQE